MTRQSLNLKPGTKLSDSDEILSNCPSEGKFEAMLGLPAGLVTTMQERMNVHRVAVQSLMSKSSPDLLKVHQRMVTHVFASTKTQMSDERKQQLAELTALASTRLDEAQQGSQTSLSRASLPPSRGRAGSRPQGEQRGWSDTARDISSSKSLLKASSASPVRRKASASPPKGDSHDPLASAVDRAHTRSLTRRGPKAAGGTDQWLSAARATSATTQSDQTAAQRIFESTKSPRTSQTGAAMPKPISGEKRDQTLGRAP
jgi:hypothetical protein